MDAGVLQVALALRCQLFTKIGAVLVLDVLDDRVPTAIVVDQVAIAGSVDDVEAQSNAVLFNYV